MDISVLCNDGSPLGVTCKDIWGMGKRGIGIGGSELALLTMCEAWHSMGHDVTLYNDPLEENASPFPQKRISEFQPQESRDILINFRSPNPLSIGARGKKIWWSCDQYSVGDYRAYSHEVDAIVCISPHHQWHFDMQYGIKNSVCIDIPVRTGDFYDLDEDNFPDTIPFQIIYNSVPDRGIQHLHAIYPKLKKALPEISLVITSDYRLWGVPNAGNQTFVSSFMAYPDVKFMGALPRQEYVQQLLKSDAQVYPCAYEELFCIANAEAQVAGAYPFTPAVAALVTTNMGTQLAGLPSDPEWINSYVKLIVDFLTSPNKEMIRVENMQKAVNRFSVPVVAAQWERLFNE